MKIQLIFSDINVYSERIFIFLTTVLVTFGLIFRARFSKSSIVSTDCSGVELVVSLTTYGKRLNSVHVVVESIALQTCKPDRVVLWLSRTEFGWQDVKGSLRNQLKRGLEIKFCDDLRSYKKLIPALQEFPSSNVVTIDDDIIYPNEMLSVLISENKKYPKSILGHRAHRVIFDSVGCPKPYVTWDMEVEESLSGRDVFLTTGAGTLFPAGVLKEEFCNWNMACMLCPTADDIWVYAMASFGDVECRHVNYYGRFKRYFLSLLGSQDEALFSKNVLLNENDKQLMAVVERYKLMDGFLKVRHNVA